jgi:hypothetical protein
VIDVAEFVARIKRERGERGEPSLIQAPSLYLLIDALLARQQEKKTAQKS